MFMEPLVGDGLEMRSSRSESSTPVRAEEPAAIFVVRSNDIVER